MKDDLDGLIKLWQPDVPEPLDFRREVWSRIERRAARSAWIERFFSKLTQPGIASMAAALALLAGAVLGAAAAGPKGPAAYLHAVNPYAQVALR